MDESLKVKAGQGYQLDSGGQLLGLMDELVAGHFEQELEEAKQDDAAKEPQAKSAQAAEEKELLGEHKKGETPEAIIIEAPVEPAKEVLTQQSNEEFFQERQIGKKEAPKIHLEESIAPAEQTQEMTIDLAKEHEVVPEEFHSIESKPVQTISAEAAEAIESKLEQIQIATKPQEPAVEKISKPILEALNIHNPQLAQELKPASTSWQERQVRMDRTRPKVSKKSFSHAKMEQLKEKFTQQIRQQIKLQIKQGIKQMDLHLKPRHLGALRIRLSVEDSAVIATFGVENQTTKELLQKSEWELSEALSEHSLELSELSVNILDDSTNPQDQGGKQTASLAELQTVRAWVSSFRLTEDQPEEVTTTIEVDEGLNIVV